MNPDMAVAWNGSGSGAEGVPGLDCLRRWFLVLTKPSGEKSALTNLERQGYRVYHPRLLRTALRRGRWVDRVVSLFPRYLFVQLDVGRQSLAPVRSTVGVSNIVRFGSDAAVVPDGIVDGLLRKADPESGLHRLNERKPLVRGSRVSVITGAFEGLEGVFDRDVGEERSVILLQVLGNHTQVCVPSAFIVGALDGGR
jgi:transcriptional antiterminator RfaH